MNDAARILVVEDERNIARGIAENLVLEGHEVEIVEDGLAALERLRAETWALVILDVMLPELDGFEVCRRLREEGDDVPVLFLTARGGGDDRVRGLEAGGDDYLAKPFLLEELLLRVAAILRRSPWYQSEPPAGARIAFGGSDFDFARLSGRAWDGREHEVPQKEAMVLKALVERAGETVPREEVLEKVWGYEVYPATRVIEDLVQSLRRRFEREPARPRHLHTVRGVGWRFTAEPEEAP